MGFELVEKSSLKRTTMCNNFLMKSIIKLTVVLFSTLIFLVLTSYNMVVSIIQWVKIQKNFFPLENITNAF